MKDPLRPGRIGPPCSLLVSIWNGGKGIHPAHQRDDPFLNVPSKTLSAFFRQSLPFRVFEQQLCVAFLRSGQELGRRNSCIDEHSSHMIASLNVRSIGPIGVCDLPGNHHSADEARLLSFSSSSGSSNNVGCSGFFGAGRACCCAILPFTCLKSLAFWLLTTVIPVDFS